MSTLSRIYTERVDDIPIIIETAKRLKFDQVINQYAHTHGHQKGLSNGQIALGWLGYVLSSADHCKVGVQEWAEKLPLTLNYLLKKKSSCTDFNDDRLTRFLKKLCNNNSWENIEKDLWKGTVDVYELPLSGVRLDSTTSYGYHERKEDGIMQLGHSKDHRPDLPQLKIMAAVTEQHGHLIGSDVVAGNHADDILYTPLIARIRDFLGVKNLLYTGDCKMAALSIRRDIAIHHDYYFTPLPAGDSSKDFKKWVESITQGTQTAILIYDKGVPVAAGYELSRELAKDSFKWNERVLVTKSFSYALQQEQTLEKNLKRAKEELLGINSSPRQGRSCITEESVLKDKIARILKTYDINISWTTSTILSCTKNTETKEEISKTSLDDFDHKILEKTASPENLVDVIWSRQEDRIIKYKGRGRGGKSREQEEVIKIRYVITDVKRNENAIRQKKWTLGWRAFVTNASVDRLSFEQSVIHYRNGWTVERGFHLFKDLPLGIRPIYVKKDEQIIGLTRFLTLGLRLLTFIEIMVHNYLKNNNKQLTGIYKGQKNRLIKRPTTQQILAAIARNQVTLAKVEINEETHWNMSEFPPHLKDILTALKIPKNVYEASSYSIENNSFR